MFRDVSGCSMFRVLSTPDNMDTMACPLDVRIKRVPVYCLMHGRRHRYSHTRYNEDISPVPWHFAAVSGFFSVSFRFSRKGCCCYKNYFFLCILVTSMCQMRKIFMNMWWDTIMGQTKMEAPSTAWRLYLIQSILSNCRWFSLR